MAPFMVMESWQVRCSGIHFVVAFACKGFRDARPTSAAQGRASAAAGGSRGTIIVSTWTPRGVDSIQVA